MTSILRPSRRQFLSGAGLTLSGLALSSCASRPWSRAPEPPVQSAEDALLRLREGNLRYSACKTLDPNQSEARRAEVAEGQHPFATVLGCVDSRVPPELVFDRGLGDLFVIRTAGQVIDHAVMGSIEFGALELGISLIVVLGHEKCGAVKATLEATLHEHEAAEGSIGMLVKSIKPAIERVYGQPGDTLDNAVRANVELVVSRLKRSPVLAKRLRDGAVKIVGGRYDLDTGLVEITAT